MNRFLPALGVTLAALLAGCSSSSGSADAACPTSYCNSHGACVAVNDLPTCACESGYEGLTCVTCAAGYHRAGTGTCLADDACAQDTCSGHGTCSVVAGEARCACEPGYDGPACASCYGPFLDVSDAGMKAGPDGGLVRAGPVVCALPATCTPGSCAPGAECDDSSGAIQCTCRGASCAAADCSANPCGPHGACDVVGGAVRCSCEAGYQGQACERCYPGYHQAADGGAECLRDEPCLATSCHGGGACAVRGGVATCTCATGYEGTTCERCQAGHHRVASGACEVDQTCAASSCGANATCAVVAGQVTCPCGTGFAGPGCGQCAPGFHATSAADGGLACALDQRCTPTTCGRGACEDGTGQVVCSNCPPGFSGAYCEINLNDCGTACQGGTCVDLVGAHVCLCTDGTWGQTCQAGPTLTQLSPASGPRLGGTTVTVTGTGFVAGTTATLGGLAVSGLNVTSATSLTFVTPAAAALGPAELRLKGLNNQTATATFTYAPVPWTSTGAAQRVVVPAGASSLQVWAWGAAGGAGDAPGVRGGAGGYAAATLPVDAGQALVVIVGRGGARTLLPDGGGTAAGTGGGLSGVFVEAADGGWSQASALLIAGGGGGGGAYANVAFGSSGGNGGGEYGGAGAQAGTTSFAARGLGGGPTSGGVGGCSTGASGAQCGQPGLPLQGGGGGVASLSSARVGATFGGGGGAGLGAAGVSGGGGGGYWGGGGGANETPQGGGGGSGFITSTASGAVLQRSAVPGEAPMTGVPGYVGGVAQGGGVDGGTAGGHGLVLISW